MDMTPIIELALIFGGVATLGFVIAEILSLYVFRSATNSMTQATTAGINAIVDLTTLSVTGLHGSTTVEVQGQPTKVPGLEQK